MDHFTSISDANPPVKFYLPATFQFGHGPGRIERFLRRVFGTHDVGGRSVAGSAGREFYLPATPDVEPATIR